MSIQEYEQLEKLASSDQMLESTVSYVASMLSRFMRRQERVLICFPNTSEASIGRIMQRAVDSIGAIPLMWGEDHRWKALLRQAFVTRASVIIAPPLLILGLTKIAKVTGTPLYIRNAVMAGYPCLDWMSKGIVRGLDCKTWTCFGPGTGALVTGFSCGHETAIHVRDDVYRVDIVDEDGNPLPDGQSGEIVVSPVQNPEIRYHTMEVGKLSHKECDCGNPSPVVLDREPGKYIDPSLRGLGAQLQAWSSILDCRLQKGECGLEIELLVFPGEKLPKLPSCAKLIVRSWDPERDAPFSPFRDWKNGGIYQDYY